jgi:hypothetical protein
MGTIVVVVGVVVFVVVVVVVDLIFVMGVVVSVVVLDVVVVSALVETLCFGIQTIRYTATVTGQTKMSSPVYMLTCVQKIYQDSDNCSH